MLYRMGYYLSPILRNIASNSFNAALSGTAHLSAAAKRVAKTNTTIAAGATAALVAATGSGAQMSVNASGQATITAYREALGIMAASGSGSATCVGSVSGGGGSGALGLKNVSAIASNIVFEITPTLTQSVANNSTQSVLDAHGDTAYEFVVGSASTSGSDDPGIVGAGTSAGKFTFDGGDHLELSGVTAGTIFETMQRSDQDWTIIFAGKLQISTNQALLDLRGASGPGLQFRSYNTSNPVGYAIYHGSGTYIGDINIGSLSTNTAFLCVLTKSGTSLSAAINARSLAVQSSGSYTDTTSSYTGPVKIGEAAPGGTNISSGGEVYNVTLLDKAINNTECAAIVDHFRTNYTDLSGLPAS